MSIRKIGAEIILSAILVPLLAWVLTSVIALQNSYATLKERSDLREETLREIKDDVKFIRQQLEK